MSKDQQIEALNETIKEMEESYKESKKRLMELYGKERSKRQAETCWFAIQKRAAEYIIDSIIEGTKPNADEFFKIEAEKVK